MIYRDFKGIKLSGLGFGMMRLPVVNGNDAVIDEKAAKEMIDYAYNNGINYFDTAWGYHDGNSELIAGKYLSEYPRESFYLASKFPGYDNSNMPKVREIFERQLEKCKTGYFDFYLIHNVYEGNIDDYLNPKFGIMDYLLEQKKNGRIKYLGFSCHGDMDVLKRFLDAYGQYMEFCQLQLNYMDWHFQKCDEKAAYLKEKDIPLWVMEPLRGGKLCKLSDDMAADLKELRADENATSWAFRFIQGIDSVKMVLSGMSDMAQLKENIKIWSEDKPLSGAESNKLVELMDYEIKKEGLPCTACHYCTSHCPMGFPIPELIALYNEHLSTKGRMSFIAPMAISSMDENKRPDKCVGCRSCEQVCPQQIKISEAMKDFSNMLEL